MRIAFAGFARLAADALREFKRAFECFDDLQKIKLLRRDIKEKSSPFSLRACEDSRVLEFIKDSFQKDQDGYIIPEHHGIYGDSQFYTGVGRYQLFNTCNKWTAKALNSGGYHLDPTFKLTSSSVMSSLDSACP